MSDLEFAKAIADSLHSSEEMIAKDDRYSKQDIVRFTDFILAAPELKNHAISRLKLDNKSLAWDADVGPGEDLAKFFLRFITTHTHALIVPDAQLKYVIEKKLKVGCFFDAHIVHELMWGLNYVLDEFVPEERDSLTDKFHLRLSKELEKKIRAYGFNVSPRIIDREFISIVGHLYSLEFISKSLSVSLRRRFGHRFPGSHRMSDLEFAKAIADSLHSSEEMMVPKDDKYSKQDIVRFTDFILAAPELKDHAVSHLKRMEAKDPLAIPDKKNPGLEPIANEDRLAVPEQKRSTEFWGKAEAKDMAPKLQVMIEAPASKPKPVGKNKKGDDSDDNSDSHLSEDDSVDGVDSDSSDDEEEEERPKKPETMKKRAAGSALKMPASNKKAKVATQHPLARRQAKKTCKYGLQAKMQRGTRPRLVPSFWPFMYLGGFASLFHTSRPYGKFMDGRRSVLTRKKKE